MNTTEISLSLNAGGTSTKLAISTSSASYTFTAASSDVKGVPVSHVLTCDVDCFIRKGTGTVTAVSDGTDQWLKANQSYRVELMDGEKMAFVTASGSGNAYITPRA